jgi:nucleotide-binding universal stress UspA family protein
VPNLAPAARATILHPTDFSPASAHAFAHALAITLASKSQLCLLQVRDDEEAFFSRTQGLRQVRDLLVRWKKLPKDASYDRWAEALDLQVSSMSIAARNARAGILEFLDSRPCDLVVLATYEHKAPTHWRDVSVPRSVLRQARMMSLFLRERAKGFVDADTGALGLRRILVPIDGALNCRLALRRIEGMVKLVSSPASIQLLHIGERAPELTDERGRPLGLPMLVRQGRVVDSILKVAGDLQADVIAMPTAGRHGLLDAVRGSTSARVLDDGRFPLLAVPVG